jgi:hypothetical protein
VPSWHSLVLLNHSNYNSHLTEDYMRSLHTKDRILRELEGGGQTRNWREERLDDETIDEKVRGKRDKKEDGAKSKSLAKLRGETQLGS